MTTTQQSKGKRRKAPETLTPEVLAALTRAFQAHKAMKKAEDAYCEAERIRRAAIAAAWDTGATAKEIAVTLEISLAKTYNLLPVGRKA